jgi:calcineurin-like phosphoesterase
MNVLFVGDVVGPAAADWLAGRLPQLRSEFAVDLVIVDAENCAADAGSMSVAIVEQLLDAGADVVTGGNHAFDGSEVDAVLSHERVVRPLNVADTEPGRGALTTTTASGEAVRVVVLADRAALDVAPPNARMTVPAYEAYRALPPGPQTTIVEMHALSVGAKQALAYALDGEVAAVLGTHTHEPTLPLRRLPGGTALVTDVGMTGSDDGPQGLDAAAVVRAVRGESGDPPGPAAGAFVMGAVLLDVADGRTRAIERIH